MSVLAAIFIIPSYTETLAYNITTAKFAYRPEYGTKLDQIVSKLKSEFKERLIKIYVVDISNIDSSSIVDPLIYPLSINDLHFGHYLPIKLSPDKKIVLIDRDSFLFDYVKSKGGILQYEQLKCFEACFDMKNHLQLMLKFFECQLNQLYFLISTSDDNYLEIIKKENMEFSSYTVFMDLHSYTKRSIFYGRYLLNDNVQSLILLQKCSFLHEFESNSVNFKVNKVIPLYRAIETYKSQTRLMGIDLGASRIVVCVSRNRHTDLIKIDREYSMPSVISFAEDEPIIGNIAKRHLAKKPELVLFDLKHLRDPKRPMSGYSWRFAHCIEPKKSSFIFQSKKLFKQYSTTEIYQILLHKIKQTASEYQFDLNEGKDVNQVVITVPNFDNKLMLENIFDAAESAELEILDIITGMLFSVAFLTMINPNKRVL